MAKVQKGNRIIEVSEDRAEGYLKQGYDLIDTDGSILKHATGGKTIPIAEHNRALEKVEELKEEVKVLEAENIRLDKIVKQYQQQRQHNKN